ncbi:DNA translocase FtsK [Lentisalinibacter orientalis]|uniref:DNA translocase FtsK n=1 Tax=Lentisalinibacter orientalis TaxID=2992241 RepID=UPI0038661083
MAKATRLKQSRTGPRAPVQAPLVRTLREAALWVFGALAIILFVALATYHPADPAFSQAGGADRIHNRIGTVGAWFSDLSYMLFGAPAYLFPVMMLFAGWLIFRERRNPEPLDRAEFGLRFAGFLLTLATSCGLGTLHFAAAELRETAGGVVGQLVGGGLQSLMGTLGATLLLLAVWVGSVAVFLGFSWLAVMDHVGHFALEGWERLVGLFDRLRDRARGRRAQQERQEVVRAEKKRTASRPKPRIEPVIPALETSNRAEKERQVPLFEPPGASELPPLSLLDDPPKQSSGYSEDALEAMSRLVELKLKDFGIDVEVVSVHPGPVITRFELDPAPGVKSAQISNLAKDLARSLSVVSVRVVEVIPGKAYIGLEIPNESRELVTLGEILRSKVYDEMASPLTLALGKDIGGNSVVADLSRMPHLMIAGTTGSGKSVGINAMVLSLLYKAQPEHVRLIMIDPKMLELSVYEDIPHLLTPVVTDMNEAANALRWCVAEMERRYKLMAALGVRGIGGYNRKVREAADAGEPLKDPTWEPPELVDEDKPVEAPDLEPLPFIVVVIDELADMMMIVGKKVEELIARLAQKARASGIHMILATQRPSVDVITGLIKANVPARIAFQVSAKVDSRTILDQQGAENLLGHGDMLFLPPGTSMPERVHGAFVADHEVHKVVKYLRKAGQPHYIDEILSGPTSPIPGMPDIGGAGDAGVDSEQDPLYDEAVRIVTETRKASISGVQRRLKIGYNRAARMVEAMEEAGLVGPLQANGSREVLAPPPPED